RAVSKPPVRRFAKHSPENPARSFFRRFGVEEDRSQHVELLGFADMIVEVTVGKWSFERIVRFELLAVSLERPRELSELLPARVRNRAKAVEAVGRKDSPATYFDILRPRERAPVSSATKPAPIVRRHHSWRPIEG